MKKILTTILAMALGVTAWGVTPPTASIVVMSAAEMEEAMSGAGELLSNIPVYGLYSSGDGYTINSQIGNSAASEAYIFQPSEGSTSDEIMTTYGDWLCDYVVSFDQGVDKSSVILAGYYGGVTMSFPIPKNFAGNNADEMFLLDSVLPGLCTYNFIVGNVGSFICTALNVSKENIGKKITVSLVIWPSNGDKVKDRHVVATIEYPFTAENLTSLYLDFNGLKVPYQYVSTGFEQLGRVLDDECTVAQQTVSGPHFGPSYTIDIKEPDAEGAVEVDVNLDASTPATVATVKVTTDATTTIASIDVQKTVDAAVKAAAGSFELDPSAENTIAVTVRADGTTGASAITYDVTPIAIVNGDTANPVELSNADLSDNASFVFDLDVTGVAAVGEWVKVVHVSDDPATYPNETYTVAAKAGGNGAVVRITTSHFSTFTLSALTSSEEDQALLPSVTNTIVSANCFGAISITDSAAATAFVAVPFGAFGTSDAPIAAADVVQAASLSEGDKMYVWNGAAGAEQKYEVYKVDANGTWVVDDKKVTVAANGTVTVGSESPDSVTVPTGTGVFIERKDATKPIFVYGQVLTNTVAETTFASGLTLVSPPSTNAMASVDLNALKWTGVGDIETKTTTSGMVIVKSYANADFIYYRNAANAIVRYYHCNGKWGTVVGTWKEAEAVIPAGTAFWYSKNGAGETKVTW